MARPELRFSRLVVAPQAASKRGHRSSMREACVRLRLSYEWSDDERCKLFIKKRKKTQLTSFEILVFSRRAYPFKGCHMEECYLLVECVQADGGREAPLKVSTSSLSVNSHCDTSVDTEESTAAISIRSFLGLCNVETLFYHIILSVLLCASYSLISLLLLSSFVN